MKAFILGLVALAVIAVGGSIGLSTVDMSAKSVFQTSNVRQ